MDKRRVWLAWSCSVLGHALLFAITVPVGARPVEQGLRLMEISLVDVATRSQNHGKPAGVEPAPPVETRPRAAALPDPARVKPQKPSPAQEPPAPKPAKSTAAVDVPAERPAASTDSGRAGTNGGGGEDKRESTSFGTGEGLVVSRAVQYPKNAQNEGVEGRVRLVILLSPDGGPRAEITLGSGDARLDNYSLRAVTEVWRYTVPPKPVRISVSLVFRQGRVEVVFEGSESVP